MEPSDATAEADLGFDDLIGELCEQARAFPDKRTGSNSRFAMKDVVLGAFSVFWTRSRSLLAHQTAMRRAHGQSNAETLFAMTQIPTDNPIRDLLDHVPPESVFPLFGQIHARLEARGHLAPCKVLDDQLLIALDGTQYHSSQSIHCDQCTMRAHRNGQVDYSHTGVTPVIVAPDHNRVLPLAPEFVTPRDGHAKQDCEHAAAKRWMRQNAQAYRDHQVTLLGNDLYAHQPPCEAALDNVVALVRAALASREMFFQHVQALTCYLCFDSFESLLDFMIQGLELTPPDTGQRPCPAHR